MTDRELMQQALSALVTAELDGNCEYGVTDSLRARLAQPDPEPVHWMKECADFWNRYTYLNEMAQEKCEERAKMWIEKLRAAPPQPEPTIDGWPLYSGLPPIKVQDEREENYKSFAQSAQVLGITEPEPVGWIGYFEGNLVSFLQTQEQVNQFLENTEPAGKVVPVYTEPPKPTKLITVGNVLERAGYVKKKEWVGLTYEEIIAVGVATGMNAVAVRMIEAKLKEKNT